MHKDTFISLINKYQAGDASVAEQVLIEEYLKRLEADDMVQLPADISAKASRIWENVQLYIRKPSASFVHRESPSSFGRRSYTKKMKLRQVIKTTWIRYA